MFTIIALLFCQLVNDNCLMKMKQFHLQLNVFLMLFVLVDCSTLSLCRGTLGLNRIWVILKLQYVAGQFVKSKICAGV